MAPAKTPPPGAGSPGRATGKIEGRPAFVDRNTASLLPPPTSETKVRSPRLFKAHGSKSFVNDPPPGAGSPRVAIFSKVTCSHRADFITFEAGFRFVVTLN